MLILYLIAKSIGLMTQHPVATALDFRCARFYYWSAFSETGIDRTIWINNKPFPKIFQLPGYQLEFSHSDITLLVKKLSQPNAPLLYWQMHTTLDTSTHKIIPDNIKSKIELTKY